MPKRKLNIKTLVAEAAKFAEVESTYDEPSLYGVTDGKAVGTYLEHKFTQYLANKSKQKWEFGDFQTPPSLAKQAISVLSEFGISPKTIIEPSCGQGSFLVAAARAFTLAKCIVGADVNAEYLAGLQPMVSKLGIQDKASFLTGDFFSLDWPTILAPLPEPILIVGNPPWVTSSELSAMKSRNLPQKSNFQKHRGLDAKTGKSNFDISESMLLQNLGWLTRRRGIIAVLCKTAVARKVLSHAWKNDYRVKASKMFLIDAQEHFGASVDACFLVIDMTETGSSKECLMYNRLGQREASQVIAYHDELILADLRMYQRWQHLRGDDKAYVWRSGIKHDCSRVMEIERIGNKYKNADGEVIALESDYLYPMLKSSDIGNGKVRYGRKFMLVTQRYVGEKTSAIKNAAPKTWRYLLDHDEAFLKRGSSIYRDRPRFSIFGVGPYSFAPWKIAISGFYNNLAFQIVSPHEQKSVVFDDTIYFLACWSEAEARFIAGLINSQPANDFYRSMIFWADKRPITVEILKRLSLRALSAELNCEAEYLRFAQSRVVNEQKTTHNQLALWA